MSGGPYSFSFYRRYHGYTGGHQKVRDYLDHTLAYHESQAYLWCDNRSQIQPDLFTDIPGVAYQSEYRPNQADVVFLAGMDWQAYLPRMDEDKPKINLIQHVRHADPEHPLHAFLQHRAIRICVSDAVRDAIAPFANGPCISIKMGHRLPQLSLDKRYDLYILANKMPDMGRSLADWAGAQGLNVKLHDSYVALSSVHESMAQSRISLTLPNPTEGFYLPGIEAMALSDWAVVPDCVANREYTHKLANVIRCEHDIEACKQAVRQAISKLDGITWLFHKWWGKRVAHSYMLNNERKSYHQVLDRLPELWNKQPA